VFKKCFSFIYTVFITLALIFVFYLFSFIFSPHSDIFNSYCLAVAFVYFILLSFCLGSFVTLWYPSLNIRRFTLHLSFVIVSLGLALGVELVRFSLFPSITILVTFISVLYLAGGAILFVVPRFIPLRRPSSNHNVSGSQEREGEKGISRSDNRYVGRRGFQRYSDDIKLRCSADKETWNCLSHDISATGMRIVSDKPVAVGKEIRLIAWLPHDSRPVYIKAKVIWIQQLSEEKKQYYIGVKFVNIEVADKIRLIAKYVFESFRR